MIPTCLTADSPVSAQSAFQNWVGAKSCSLCVISSITPPPETGGILVNLSTLPSSQLCPPSLGSLHHSPSQGFSAMRSSGQSSQVICETTATEAIISYCGHQEPASQGLCCLWTWTDWMRLHTSLRPQASPLSSREGSNSPCVFAPH